jgi:hypothetical protein
MKSSWQTGFDSVMKERTTMHHWRHLQTLFSQGSNREAAAIVRSFEVQMEFEMEVEAYQLQEQQPLAS